MRTKKYILFFICLDLIHLKRILSVYFGIDGVALRIINVFWIERTMNMNEKQDYMEIDLLSMLGALLKKWWIMALSAVLGAVIVGGYSYLFIAPRYQSSILLYVNNSSIRIGSTSVSLSSGELSSAKPLGDTYCVILSARLTLEDVIEKAELDYSYEELKSMIRAGSENNTEVFRVVVTSTDPEESCKIANTIAAVLPEKIADVVDGSSVKIVDMAVVPVARSSPSYSRYAAIGMLLGIVISAAGILLRTYLNDTISSSDWLVESFKEECPVISVIPKDGSKGKKYGKYGKYGRAYDR